MVFPSLYEGFGLPPLEAMAAGTPVLGSNTASVPEICKNHIVYFSPLDISDIEKNIAKAQDSTITPEVIRSIMLNYSWDSAARKYVRLFK